jgi:hypothetical protein
MRPITLACVVTLLLVFAAPARAGTYEVRGCDSRSVSGWSPQAAGAYNGWGDGCAAGGDLTLHNLIGSPGGASWRFDAPAHTEIAGFSVARRWWLAPGRPYGTMVYRLETYGSGDRYRNYLPNFGATQLAGGPSWESGSGLTGQTALVLGLDCGGGLACNAPGGEAAISAARVTLRDATAPEIVAVSGGPAQGAALSGRELLAYSARDLGGGLWRAELRVDGAAIAVSAVDGNDGRCAEPFRHVVPCRTATSQTMALETRALPDGVHALELRVVDVAGNAATWRRTVTVANSVPTPPQHGGAPVTAARGARITAWLERDRRRGRIVTAAYGKRVRIHGRVTDTEGRPLAGTTLTMAERLVDGLGRSVARAVRGHDASVGAEVRGSAARRWPAVTRVRTRAEGRFTALAPVGPSRRIEIVGPGGARAPRLVLRVRAAVTARALRTGTGALVRGRVRGGYVPRGTLVELQTRSGYRWTTRLVLRTRAGGRFAATLAAPSPGPLRARVPSQPGLPYMTGSSPAFTVDRWRAQPSSA